MAIHLPQALHASLSTTAIPSTIWIASNGHAFTQLPKPRHPKEHPFGPPCHGHGNGNNAGGGDGAAE